MDKNGNNKKRILVAGFTNDAGGTERVIVNYTSRMNDEFIFDYICKEHPSRYVNELSSESRFFIVPHRSDNPAEHQRSLHKIFSKHSNEYSAIWSHLSTLSNIDALKHAYSNGIPVRIAHMHSRGEVGALHTRVLGRLHRKKLSAIVTDEWACSRQSAEFFFPDGKGVVIPNAIPQSHYEFDDGKRTAIRHKYGIEGKLVLGTLGRISKEKNQAFLIDVLTQMLTANEDAVIMLVGDGDLRADIEHRSVAEGIGDRVIVTGIQTDVQAYLSAFDVFCLPSFYEAFPMVLVEAQFNGLPCLISDTITNEVVFSSDVLQLPLNSIESWSNAALSASRNRNHMDAMIGELFDIEIQAKRLQEFIAQRIEELTHGQ